MANVTYEFARSGLFEYHQAEVIRMSVGISVVATENLREPRWSTAVRTVLLALSLDAISGVLDGEN